MLSLRIASASCFWKRPPRSFSRVFSSTPSTTQAKVSAKKNRDEPRDKWNYNTSPFNQSANANYSEFQNVTANSLESATTPPRGVKMLARDFIEDSLYNPNYGYFPKQATIFDTQDSTVKFEALRDSVEFQVEVAKKYAGYGADKHDGPGRQLWHTPTELFKVDSYAFPRPMRRSHIFTISLGTEEQSLNVSLRNTS